MQTRGCLGGISGSAAGDDGEKDLPWSKLMRLRKLNSGMKFRTFTLTKEKQRIRTALLVYCSGSIRS